MNLSTALFGPRRAAARLIRRADRARDTGDHSKAAKFYYRALDLTPARTDIRVQLGHMLKELGKYQAAESAYRRALSRSPDDGDIHLQLGHLLKLTGRKQEAIAAYQDAARLLTDSSAPAAELSALGAEGAARKQVSQEEVCEARIRDGDRLRDTGDYEGSADAYGAAVTLAPTRTDIRVQYDNMLKDAARLGEAEAAYRIALAQAPQDGDIHLQLGHTLKLQGRRAAALECYRRAAELAPFRVAPQRELSGAGERANQEYLFEVQLRLGGVDALMEATHRLLELRAALDRIAETLPDIQAQLAFPVACYDRFRELYGVCEPPPASVSRSFVILLLADREGLETLRAQITAVMGQSHRDWILRVIGADPARYRLVEQMAATDPRIAWVEAADANGVAATERGAAIASRADWILLLAERALLHPNALAWFAAAAERAAASAFVTDEETVTRDRRRLRYSAPEFRQVVDYDTLLETNPFGETIAVERAAYARVAERLAIQSIATARSLLLLNLARDGRVGHIPCALVARDGEGVVDPERAAEAHEQAVHAHIAVAGLDGRLVIGPRSSPTQRSIVRWLPRVADTPIAVVIPTRDNAEDLRAAIDSLRRTAQQPQALRVVVVDNGSREPESRRVIDDLARQSWAQILLVDEPFNWSRLNNRAVAAVDLPLLLFCNDDIVMLSEGWDDVLRGLLDRHEIGAVGARLLYPDETVQHAGVLFGWRGGTIHDGLYEGRWEPGPASRWQVTRAVGAVTGAFLATRRELFSTHGGFDEAHLPVSYSDFDYALKLRASGLKILWTPEITAYHHESKSRGPDHLDPEKRARYASECSVMERRWGAAMTADPSVNPIWHMATLPFRLLSAPSQTRLWAHIDRCAAANPWLLEANSLSSLAKIKQ
jgi:GT2 family glycosyltransferase/tetratricopeptide (TPR) repeat protein